MAYSGKYRPVNRRKYKGDWKNIVYRSLWELKFMKMCDADSKVIEWGSEEIIIPYISPVDNRMHRYFPDFYVKTRLPDGKFKKYIIEIKPLKQTAPPKQQKRHTKKYLAEVKTYAINEAKWTAALHFCKRNDCEFKILTEKELKI